MNVKKNKGGKAVLAALMALMVTVLGTLGFLVLKLLGRLQVNPGETPGSYGSLEDLPEDPAYFETLCDITDATDLKSFLFQWWGNGGEDMIRYSRDVVNVLLIGVDDNGQPGSSRSDTMMLASVNRKKRTITLLSFLRDSYCYFEADGEGYYHRLNSAYYYGGPAGVMQAISRLYKIRVDKYITVDFNSFPKLIDALGGVSVEITQAEAQYLNRNAQSVTRKLEPGPAVPLNGTEALAYSRIRKLDSDMERAGRQQKVIESILRSARGANLVQLYNALDDTLPYVRTNYTRTELLGLIPQAMNWLGFETVHMGSPVLLGENSNAIGGTINGMSILIVDYPKAAQQVQLALYGESNIDLREDGHRNAYIEGLFAGAAQRRSTAYEASRTSQANQYEETPGDGGNNGWMNWFGWGGTEASTQPPEPPAPPEEPVTEDTTYALWPF